MGRVELKCGEVVFPCPLIISCCFKGTPPQETADRCIRLMDRREAPGQKANGNPQRVDQSRRLPGHLEFNVRCSGFSYCRTFLFSFLVVIFAMRRSFFLPFEYALATTRATCSRLNIVAWSMDIPYPSLDTSSQRRQQPLPPMSEKMTYRTGFCASATRCLISRFHSGESSPSSSGISSVFCFFLIFMTPNT